MKMLNQTQFAAAVGKLTKLKANSVKSKLSALRFEPAEYKPEGQYNRPYYTKSQVAKAVGLIKSKRREP